MSKLIPVFAPIAYCTTVYVGVTSCVLVMLQVLFVFLQLAGTHAESLKLNAYKIKALEGIVDSCPGAISASAILYPLYLYGKIAAVVDKSGCATG